MADTKSEIDEPTDDAEPGDAVEDEPSEAELADATVPPDPGAPPGEVESIQEMLTKQEAAEEAAAEEEDEVVVPLTKEEKLTGDQPEARVVPMQETEFVCKRCFLVKHRGQLADKKKMLCRDCA